MGLTSTRRPSALTFRPRHGTRQAFETQTRRQLDLEHNVLIPHGAIVADADFVVGGFTEFDGIAQFKDLQAQLPGRGRRGGRSSRAGRRCGGRQDEDGGLGHFRDVLIRGHRDTTGGAVGFARAQAQHVPLDCFTGLQLRDDPHELPGRQRGGVPTLRRLARLQGLVVRIGDADVGQRHVAGIGDSCRELYVLSDAGLLRARLDQFDARLRGH